MIRGIIFFYYVGWNDFPLAILQVLPLVRAILANPEAGLEYVAVAAARLVRKTEPTLCGRVHFLLVEPFVMLHRRIVRISTDGKQKKNTECRHYTIERFHGSLRVDCHKFCIDGTDANNVVQAAALSAASAAGSACVYAARCATCS